MRIIALLLFMVVLPLGSYAQSDDNPVVWEQQVHKISDTEYELVMQASIYEGWHLYSQFPSEFGAFNVFF